MAGLIWAIVVVLFVIWLLSFFAFHVTGGFIHILIVIAIILLVYNLVTGRGARL
ncbi:MAG TPA: lmo0937 family membrane protein [Candidatus Elarobacter sp.]|nr:lmo0937 family membrane protein [Candidatus Elarobacter sp.]